MLVWLAWALLCSEAAGVGSGAAPAPTRVVYIAPVSERVSPQDDVFLCAVAAAASKGKPVVCAVDAGAPWRPELLDYLRRYRPGRVVWLGPAPQGDTPPGLPLERIDAGSPVDGACALAASTWRRSARAVAYSPDDRAAALAAAVLAARMRVPLFPCSAGALPDKVRECVEGLGVTKLLVVGAPGVARPKGARFRVEHLADALAVARRLVRERLAVDYLAVAHPLDGGNGGVPRLSLSAVLLAAGRGGAVVPLPFNTTWKRRFATGKPVARAPEGTHPSKAGHRVGMVEVHGAAYAFVVGQDTANDRWWAQFDLDGNGRYDGAGEEPVRTGGTVSIGDTRYAVDLDVLENERGSAVWLTAPAPGDIVELVGRYRKAIGRDPRYLCLAGWPEAVPMAITGDAQGTDADLVTDHPYAQTDADPFVDLAFARFVAEDAASGTLLACRSLTFEDIRGPELAASYATAEWIGREGNLLELAGLRHAGHHEGPATIGEGSPLTRVGAILHSSHSWWRGIGSTYAWDTKTLLSPCVVITTGCSPAALDQDQERRSVAARMLRNGAVAFVGNGRRGIAQGALYFTEYQNALLRGETLGEANRSALNRYTVAILDKREDEHGSYRYQRDHVAAYGDPALDLGLRSPRAAARVEVRGTRANVVVPSNLTRTEYAPLPEWKCRFPKLWAWNALGLGTETRWRGGDNHDVDDLMFTAEVRSRSRLVGVEPIDNASSPLGWTGSCYVDEHSDGTRSLYWRCRVADCDKTTGTMRQQVATLGFRLVTRSEVAPARRAAPGH
jgi:hypothetical protein